MASEADHCQRWLAENDAPVSAGSDTCARSFLKVATVSSRLYYDAPAIHLRLRADQAVENDKKIMELLKALRDRSFTRAEVWEPGERTQQGRSAHEKMQTRTELAFVLTKPLKISSLMSSLER